MRHWRHGKEIYVVVHLWMAVEALTEVAMQRAREREGCETWEELAELWHIPADSTDCESCARRSLRNRLNGEIRRRYIFHEDRACSHDTREASDGFEHSYMGFEAVYALASAVRDRAAQHIRQAILELSDVPDEVISTLTSSPFDTVRASWPFAMYVRGDFIGEAAHLAAPDERYPLVRWEHRLKSFRRNPDGTAKIQLEDNMTVKCGEGVVFQPKSREVWAPENDPILGDHH